MRHSGSPSIFRTLLAVSDLAISQRFYEALLGTKGRLVAPGRMYFDCGKVILGILDVSSLPKRTRPTAAEALYFATDELDIIYRRAAKLKCLDPTSIHGDPENPAGRMVVRPWGELSFYVNDPSGNPLCFVATSTLFTGTPRQIRELRRPSPSSPPSDGTKKPVARNAPSKGNDRG
jgi:catechol 2,3-dioxygenase-like lactoylglutathione lyase family enzyme